MTRPRWTYYIRKAAARASRKWPWAVAGFVIAAAGIRVSTILANVELPEIPPPAQSSRVLAYDGQVIATLHGEENRLIVPLEKISPFLQVAVLSTEDREFFRHKGMSVRAVIRAARANVESGEVLQGGSTITQQYVRNTFPHVGKERTLLRKVKEAFWAIQLERHYPKNEIMERYLNTVYFGRGAYGAEAAARTYFKVSAAELTPGQAAYLAGLIRSPQRYQIDENPEGAVAIRNTVIKSMVRGKYLGPREGEAAMAEDLRAQFKPGLSIEVDSPRAGYFVEYVRRTLKSQFNLTDEDILQGGLQIHTTLDLRMQDAAEAAMRSVLNRPDDPEAAVVAMDPEGRVRAMVGGRDVDSIDRSRGFNFAADVNHTGGGRPAGSAFKPFALAAFLDEGKSLQSSFVGASTIKIDAGRCKNGDKPWEVSNFGHSSFGMLDVTAATLSSVNTVYAQIMDKVVSPEKFIEMAGKTGIPIPTHDAGCALTLGTTDVTPLEMAQAYTTFAQRGKRPEPLVVLKITRPNGEVVVENGPKMEQVLNENVADTVNHVLEKNIQSGTGTGARIGRPAAGKTGTTQNFQDAWFAGYTPQLTAVVWMGYAPGPDGKIAEMTRVRGRQVTGGSFPATIWREFMSRALEGVRPTGFRKPVLGGEVVGHRPPSSATLASAGPVSAAPSNRQSRRSDDTPVVRVPRQSDFNPFVSGGSDDDDDDYRPPSRRETRSTENQMFPSCFPFCD
ncbi:MAG: transglycosylase domain-containing protein [Actinomycetota bacterium]|nr:transglycosylase domain-containing protein [Actinomycetota bacterium]